MLFRRPCRNCGRVPISVAASCAGSRTPLPRIDRAQFAAPVPSSAIIPGRPVYATRLIVRADSKFSMLEQTFGGRLGYAVQDLHSGYNALRHHLLPYYRHRGAGLYKRKRGATVYATPGDRRVTRRRDRQRSSRFLRTGFDASSSARSGIADPNCRDHRSGANSISGRRIELSGRRRFGVAGGAGGVCH